MFDCSRSNQQHSISCIHSMLFRKSSKRTAVPSWVCFLFLTESGLNCDILLTHVFRIHTYVFRIHFDCDGPQAKTFCTCSLVSPPFVLSVVFVFLIATTIISVTCIPSQFHNDVLWKCWSLKFGVQIFCVAFILFFWWLFSGLWHCCGRFVASVRKSNL